MKKPSLKDKLLTAQNIEAAHQRLAANAPKTSVQKTETAAPPASFLPSEPPPVFQPLIETAVIASANPKSEIRNPKSSYGGPRRASRNADAPPVFERNVRITVDMPESLHERLKLQSVIQKTSLREFVLQAVERELARK